jgi:hypothetical protein
MSNDNAINDALNHINQNARILKSEPTVSYIQQDILDNWNYTDYTLKRGKVVTTEYLNSTPSINGPSHGYSTSNHPIDKIYMFKNDVGLIATFMIENGKFVIKEPSGGSNKKTKNVKSKRRTKRSKRTKRTKRKHTRKYKMK